MQQGFEFQPTYSPSRLNREVKRLLEQGFASVWVEGELSSLSQPSSGHAYFSLKDDNAQLRCALFRQHKLRQRVVLEPGLQVRVRGRLSLFEARGDYQLIADKVELAGQGRLLAEFEALKRKLAAEGLFEAEAKQSLPLYPHHVAVVTSDTGAAIRDVLSVWQRRAPAMRVTVVPTLVQGAEAPTQIARAVHRAEQLNPDVILLTRGGGSMEDLWAFNDETVARVIHGCAVPVVAAIGHEVDTTIADFVADASAVTPSAGAESITPDRAELLARLSVKQRRLSSLFAATLQRRSQQVDFFERQLRQLGPLQQLTSQRQQLLSLTRRWQRLGQQLTGRPQQQLSQLQARLVATDPRRQLQMVGQRLERLQRRQRFIGTALLRPFEARLRACVAALNAMNPLSVLERGYSLTTTTDGDLVDDVNELTEGQSVETTLARGRFTSQVIKISSKPEE